MKKFICYFYLLFIYSIIFANNNTTSINENSNKNKTEFSTGISVILQYSWGALLNITESVKIPALNYPHFLTKDNNVTFNAGFDFTLISIEAFIEAIWSPAAFLELYSKMRVGSGWSLANGKIQGFYQNVNKNGKSERQSFGLSDVFVLSKFGGILKFDTGALIQNDWAHIALVTDQGFLHRTAGSLSAYDSWGYQEDNGEIRNGWLYTSSYILAYLMPAIPMDKIGIKVDTEKYLHKNIENQSLWGDGRTRVYFGPFTGFKVTDFLNILFTLEWYTAKNYTNKDETIHYTEKHVNRKKPQNICFYRALLIFNFTYK